MPERSARRVGRRLKRPIPARAWSRRIGICGQRPRPRHERSAGARPSSHAPRAGSRAPAGRLREMSPASASAVMACYIGHGTAPDRISPYSTPGRQGTRRRRYCQTRRRRSGSAEVGELLPAHRRDGLACQRQLPVARHVHGHGGPSVTRCSYSPASHSCWITIAVVHAGNAVPVLNRSLASISNAIARSQ